jgi:hypothetical protein
MTKTAICEVLSIATQSGKPESSQFNIFWMPDQVRHDDSWTFYETVNVGIWNLPFDLAQGGESFDFAQDREPVERLVEPFAIWVL